MNKGEKVNWLASRDKCFIMFKDDRPDKSLVLIFKGNNRYSQLQKVYETKLKLIYIRLKQGFLTLTSMTCHETITLLWGLFCTLKIKRITRLTEGFWMRKKNVFFRMNW